MIEKGVALELEVEGTTMVLAEDAEMLDGLKERSSVRKDA